MKSIKYRVPALFLGALLLMPVAVQAVIVEKVAARVDSQVITLFDVRQKTAELRDMYRSIRRPVPADIQKQALDKLINEQLVLLQAKQEGIVVTDLMVKQQVDDMLKARAWTLDMLKTELAKQGMDLTKLQEQLRRQLMLKQLFKKKKGDIGDIKPTQKEIQDFYNQNAPVEKRVMHLYIRLNPGTGFIARDKIEKRITAVENGLKQNRWQFLALGGRYADAVKDYGYLVPKRELPKYLFPAFSLNNGQLRSFRVTTELPAYPGYHALFIAGERRMPLDKVRDVIERRLQEQKFNDALEKWVKKLRSSANIKINI